MKSVILTALLVVGTSAMAAKGKKVEKEHGHDHKATLEATCGSVKEAKEHEACVAKFNTEHPEIAACATVTDAKANEACVEKFIKENPKHHEAGHHATAETTPATKTK